MEAKDKTPNCFNCTHLSITSNAQFPRACKVYGFKGPELPSVTVLKVTGGPCQAFELKKKLN